MARSIEELQALARQRAGIATEQPRRSMEELQSLAKSRKPQRSMEELQAAAGGGGEIGFFESSFEDAVQKVPGSLAGVEQAMELSAASSRLQVGDYKKPPVIGVAPSPAAVLRDPFSFGYYGAVSQIAAGGFKAWTPEHQKNYDAKQLEDYFIEQDERARRGYTFGGKVGAITSEMPSFMFDFMATGGLRSIGSKAGRKAATNMLRRHATTSAGKAAIATRGLFKGATYRAAGLPHRAVEAIAKRRIPKDMKILDDGTVEIEGVGEGMATSVVKGMADHWITLMSEDAGSLMVPAFKKTFGPLARKMPVFKKLIPRMQAAWTTKTGKSVAAFNKKIADVSGFHGTANELGEEWLDMNLKAALDIDSTDATSETTIAQRFGEANKEFLANLPVMTAAFMIPGGPRMVGGLVSVAVDKRAENIVKYNMMIKEADTAEAASKVGEEYLKALGVDTRSWSEETAAEKALKIKEPGITKYFTPKWLVNRQIGVEDMLEAVELASMAMHIERNDLQSWTTGIIKKLRKEKDLARLPEILEEVAVEESKVDLNKMFGGEAEVERDPTFIPRDAVKKSKAHILQKKIGKETNPIHIMRDLLDTYEDAPDFLSESEAAIFNEVRGLTRSLLKRVNAARRERGDADIPDVGAYITHWIDAAAEDKLEQRIVAQSKKKRKLSRHIPNYTAEKRKIKDEIEGLFTKDLGKALQQMVKYDLRDIYITKPYQEALAELNELDSTGMIHPNTYRTIENFLRYDIREMETRLDREFNKSVKGAADFLKMITFGKVVIDDPARQVFGAMRKFGFVSALGLRIKAPLRNLGQRMLLQDLYRTRDYAKAQAVAARLKKMPQVKHPTTGAMVNVIDLLREQPWYKLATQQFEDLVTAEPTATSAGKELFDKTSKKALWAYSKSHAGSLFLSNVEVSALTGYFDWENNFKQSQKGTEHYKNARRYSVKHNVPLDQLLTSQEDMLYSMRDAVRQTQWEYFSTSMPTIFRGQIARASFQFKSWMMNYYFNHVREMSTQMYTGRNSRGKLIPGKGRFRAVKGLGTIVAMGSLMEEMLGIHVLKFLITRDIGKLFMLDAPIPNFILSLAGYFAADGPDERKKEWKKLKKAMKFWLPYSLAMKDYYEVMSGEQDFSELFFYMKKEGKNG